MEQIRRLNRFVVIVMYFVCLGFSVGMCFESDNLIKTYVSTSKHSDDLLDSTKLQVPFISKSDWNSLVLASKVPVMVMFTAYVCGPCRAMSPILDQLDSEFIGRFKFYRVNIDEEPYISARYNIRALPTTIVFKSAKEMATLVGTRPVERLREIVEKYM